MCETIRYLHEDVQIVHRDVKLENWMMNRGLQVKLIDFGMSKPTTDVLSTGCGTYAYLSPEMILGEAYSTKTDVWSLGVVLFAMVTGRLPFVGASDQMVFYNIVYSEPQYPVHMSEDLQALLTHMLEKNPEERWSMREVLDSDWMKRPEISRRHSQEIPILPTFLDSVPDCNASAPVTRNRGGFRRHNHVRVRATPQFGTSQIAVLLGLTDSAQPRRRATTRIRIAPKIETKM
jgi:serine/threonine protein kinase